MGTLFLPTLEGGDTCSLIVKTLSEKQPLSAKQIHAHIKADGALFSYQAVHKALQKLQADGVVEKEGKHYSLSKNWLDGLKQFIDASTRKLARASLFLDDSWPKNLEFSRLIELATFCLESSSEFTKLFPNATKIGHWKHIWPSLIFSKDDYTKLKSMANENCVGLVNGNSFADKFIGGYWEEFGAKLKYGVNCASECDLISFGDYIVYVYFSPDLRKEFNAVYDRISKTKKKDFALQELFDLVHHYKTSIRVVVNKNAAVAEQIQRETLKYFKK